MRLVKNGIFKTIQGEGKYMEVPSIFIRTSGCNMRCQWGSTRCDTPYSSWEAENNQMNIDDIVDNINDLNKDGRINHIVITGGEPTIQRGDLTDLVNNLYDKDYHITIESNGTYFIPEIIDKVYFSFSPKLNSSIPNNKRFEKLQRRYINKSKVVVKKYIEEGAIYQLKFVVDRKEDFIQIEDFISLVNAKKSNIYLMPQGITIEQLDNKEKWIKEYCNKRGYNFADRLHIRLFGNTRGT